MAAVNGNVDAKWFVEGENVGNKESVSMNKERLGDTSVKEDLVAIDKETWEVCADVMVHTRKCPYCMRKHLKFAS